MSAWLADGGWDLTVRIIASPSRDGDIRMSRKQVGASVVHSSQWPPSVRRSFASVPAVSEIVPPGSQWRPEYEPTGCPSQDSMTSSQPRGRRLLSRQEPSAQTIHASSVWPAMPSAATRPLGASTS